MKVIRRLQRQLLQLLLLFLFSVFSIVKTINPRLIMLPKILMVISLKKRMFDQSNKKELRAVRDRILILLLALQRTETLKKNYFKI